MASWEENTVLKNEPRTLDVTQRRDRPTEWKDTGHTGPVSERVCPCTWCVTLPPYPHSKERRVSEVRQQPRRNPRVNILRLPDAASACWGHGLTH